MNIDKAAERFLSLKLPEDFAPDAGISFNPYGGVDTPHWPVGTNLFTRGQVLGILRHILQSETEMDFGQALEALKAGLKVARVGWNGKGMFVFFVAGTNFIKGVPYYTITSGGEFGAVDLSLGAAPFIAMRAADGMIVPWLASQTDMIAKDWVEV